MSPDVFPIAWFALLVVWLVECWRDGQDNKRARARRDQMLHIDPARTAGGGVGKYQMKPLGNACQTAQGAADRHRKPEAFNRPMPPQGRPVTRLP